MDGTFFALIEQTITSNHAKHLSESEGVQGTAFYSSQYISVSQEAQNDYYFKIEEK